MKLTIGYLYPELFNLYGDQGNIRCLEKRTSFGLGSRLIRYSFC